MASCCAGWYVFDLRLSHVKHLIYPLGFPAVPHRLVMDDVYEGYFLPAGSIVIGNTW
jgi:hypothetical protein